MNPQRTQQLIVTEPLVPHPALVKGLTNEALDYLNFRSF